MDPPVPAAAVRGMQVNTPTPGLCLLIMGFLAIRTVVSKWHRLPLSRFLSLQNNSPHSQVCGWRLEPRSGAWALPASTSLQPQQSIKPVTSHLLCLLFLIASESSKVNFHPARAVQGQRALPGI